MLEEVALVVEAHNDQLWLETQTRSSCSQCANNSCGTSLIARLFAAKPNRLQLTNTLDAKSGDQVIIGIPDELLVRAAVWAYLLPLFTMVLVAIGASMAGAGDGLQSVLALTGLATGLVLVQRYTRSNVTRQRFQPRLLRLVNQAESPVKTIKFSKSI